MYLSFASNCLKVIICDVNLMSFILNVFKKFTNIESSSLHQPVLSEYRSVTNEFQEEDMNDAAVS